MANKIKIDTCRLCMKPNQELQQSHILPEWMYRPTYDEKGRVMPLSTCTDPKRKVKPLQKGIRENLLCSPCERKLGKYEAYVSGMCQKHIYSASHKIIDKGILIDPCNIKSLRLFQLANLWRASISSVRDYSDVKLGPYEEKIRKLLLNDDPGSLQEFICFMQVIYHGGAVIVDCLTPFTKRRFNNDITLYSFQGGGCNWLYAIGGKTPALDEYKKKLCLQYQDNQLSLSFIDLVKLGDLRRSIQDLRDLNRLARPLY